MKSTPLRLGENGELFAIYCRPERVAGKTCVVMLNSGLLDQTGPYRLYVQFADRLAAAGISSLRVDLNGKGESVERAGMDYGRALAADADAIERYLDRVECRHVVLMGLCSGAMDAVEIASGRARVDGLILIDGFALNTPASTRRYYFRRLLRPSAYLNWIRCQLGSDTAPEEVFGNPLPDSNAQIERYRAILQRGVPVLAVYSNLLEWHYNRQGQLAAALAPCANLRLLDESYLPEADHVFTTVIQRDRVVHNMTDWTLSQVALLRDTCQR